MKSKNYLVYGILVLAVLGLMISGCGKKEEINQTTDNNSNEYNTVQTPPEFFDANVLSPECKWIVKTENNVKSNCIQAMIRGVARGPVGSRLELPIFIWSTDQFDCGGWTSKKGALIAVGHTCIRGEADPGIMNWTVKSEGCPLKDYFESERKYSVKIYNNTELEIRAQDEKNVGCK